MLLIFTHKITNRLSYTARQLFEKILGIEISFTTKVEDFIRHTGPKLTYSKQPLQNEFFIRSNDLLFEQGINDFDIKVDSWEGVPCFFPAGDKSSIPYDLFSASFFLLSRYEEYLPHVKDGLGRFPAKESIAYQNKFLEIPVVDLWAFKLLDALKLRFPDLQNTKKTYSCTSIINVTTSHAYAHRGWVRGLGGFLRDLGSFAFMKIARRISVFLGFRKDPYDNFYELVEIHKKFLIKTMFFFQFAKYSTHDKNISPNNNKFRYLIKSVADYSVVSLSTSFLSSTDKTVLKEEKRQLANLINRPINYSRLRYNRVNVPMTYRNLIETEFTDDFSMGYTHEIGFRAGTCTPFYFYDINMEVRQPLKVHPFVVHDYALINFKNRNEIFDKMDGIYRQIKEVNGGLIMIFSNELLGSPKSLTGWSCTNPYLEDIMFREQITDVFFDLDHTLWDFEKNSALTFQKILGKNGMDVVLDDFLKAYVPINLDFWKLYRENRISKSELRYQRLKKTFDTIGAVVSDESIHLLAHEYIENLSSFTHLFPDTIEILEYLEPRYKLHIITNGFQEIQEKKLKGSNIYKYFDAIIDSEMAGVKKPHPYIFELALKTARVASKNALMIGDNLEADILGAKSAGFHTLHFNAHGESSHNVCKMIDALIEIKSIL